MRRVVEHCENWFRMHIGRGEHCFNCARRDGYPYRAQPDKKCLNFKIRDTEPESAHKIAK